MTISNKGRRDASGKLVKQQLYSLRQAAEWLAVSEKTVRRRIAAAELRSYLVGRQIRIPEDELLAFLAKRTMGD